MKPSSLFESRTILIATKHGKESAIAPILKKVFGLKAILPDNFDTDLLGTFTGEIERTLDPYAAAKEKCRLAMEATGCDLAVASEGSFGPHPSAYFLNADDEILVLIDRKNNLEISVRELSTETNFAGRLVSTLEDLFEFADEVKFPSHALILRASKNDFNHLHKGIREEEILTKAYDDIMKSGGSVYAETDMRAHLNPTRMKVIEAATQKLVHKMKTRCPKCEVPGFDVVEVKPGLPCNLCGFPTRSSLALIYKCKSCAHTRESLYPNGKETEDPTYCDRCNP